MNTVILILGPTASGKSNLAYLLAKKLHTELISADSRQIFKYTDVCTAKSIFSDIKTYLIDIKYPNEEYSAFEFKNDATEIINDLLKNNKVPIIVGGTNFYIDVLINKINLSISDSKFKDLYDKYKNTFKDTPINTIQDELKKIDPNLYNKLSNSEKFNRHRLVRNISLSKYNLDNPTKEEKVIQNNFKVIKIGINTTKEELNKSIRNRIEEMFESNKIINEVLFIISNYGPNCKILNTIGYKEIIDKTKGKDLIKDIEKLNSNDIEDIKNRIYFNTIHYAKRQMTWLKRDNDIKWVDNNEVSNFQNLLTFISSQIK